jgi:hypothetical protein
MGLNNVLLRTESDLQGIYAREYVFQWPLVLDYIANNNDYHVLHFMFSNSVFSLNLHFGLCLGEGGGRPATEQLAVDTTPQLDCNILAPTVSEPVSDQLAFRDHRLNHMNKTGRVHDTLGSVLAVDN